MLTHRAIQLRAFPSMFSSSRPRLVGLTALIALLAFIGGLGASDLTALSRVEPSSQIVDRTLKGDRLPLAPASHPNAVNQPLRTGVPRKSASDLKLPDGCELLVSPLTDFHLARMAGRCVS